MAQTAVIANIPGTESTKEKTSNTRPDRTNDVFITRSAPRRSDKRPDNGAMTIALTP
jgi:hypothetical protein